MRQPPALRYAADGVGRVRLPGERAMQRYRDQLAHGVALYPAILPALAPWAEKYSVEMPSARA